MCVFLCRVCVFRANNWNNLLVKWGRQCIRVGCDGVRLSPLHRAESAFVVNICSSPLLSRHLTWRKKIPIRRKQECPIAFKAQCPPKIWNNPTAFVLALLPSRWAEEAWHKLFRSFRAPVNLTHCPIEDFASCEFHSWDYSWIISLEQNICSREF